MRRLILISCLVFIGCADNDSTSDSQMVENDTENTRIFKMGFTPWLYEASFTAQDLVYDQIQSNGDIISHHLMGGIPWQEAFDKTPYPAQVEAELATRLEKTRTDTAVYLSIDSLNGLRTELAPNWGATENEPRTGDWATRSFSSPEVITAYTNFSLDMISRFKPDYFNYAVEVSVLMFNSPTAYDDFVSFSSAIYNNIKAVHPNLPMLVSLSLKTPNNAEMQIVKSDFERIANYVDIAGISIYPYAFFDHANKGNPSNMPNDWLSQISTLAPNKPFAITEVAWAAEDLVIPTYSIDLAITAENQQQFMDALFQQATEHNAAFIIWFCLYDYDVLWNTLLLQDDIGRIWRDTGFYDENLNPRTALTTWQEWYAKTLVNN